MTRRIVLVRHGRPTIVRDYRRWAWVAGRDLATLLAHYDASGIDQESSPGDGLAMRVRDVERVFSSDLRRACESASRLGLGERATQDPLFREAMPPSGFLPSWRLPMSVWLFVARVVWILGLPVVGETWREARARAERAAARLEAASTDGGAVVLVAHGWINWLIREALLRRGWSASGQYATEYWAHNELTRGA